MENYPFYPFLSGALEMDYKCSGLQVFRLECLIWVNSFCFFKEKDVRPDGRNLEEFRPTVLNIGKSNNI